MDSHMKRLEKMRKKSENGVALLLKELQRIQPDLPPEKRDDSTFATLAILFELSKSRDEQIRHLQQHNVATWIGIIVIMFTIAALHAEVPWIGNLFDALLG